MHKSVQWRMVTWTLTSRIMWNRSKLCTKTLEKQLEPLGFPQITYAASQTPRCPTGWQGPQHTGHPNLTGFLGMRASSQAGTAGPWCLSSNRVQAGKHFSRLGMEYSISEGKKEPFSEPGLAKLCRGTRGSWPLSWVFSALCSETDAFRPMNWLAAVYQDLGTALDLQLTGARQPQISPELPQQLQGLNLRPWRSSSNLLKSAISNATAQILPLTQNEELLRDFGQIMG